MLPSPWAQIKRSGAAGLPPIRFHDLRHTFGTQAAAAGVPLRTLQEWMGHRDYKTTLIYADYAPRTYERELMERAFGSTGIDVVREPAQLRPDET